jgi:hypothetical protein
MPESELRVTPAGRNLVKKLAFFMSMLLTAGIPLWRTYQDRQRRRSRLQALAGAARDRATGPGESARHALTALLQSATAIQARDLDTRQRAAASAGLAGRAGAAVATIPRLVEQFQAGAGIARGGNEDWRAYGEVFK